jgi:prefoldin subunit 5
MKPGVRQMEVALHDVLVDRGPTWDQCRRGQVDADSGDVKVTIEAPTPHGVKDGAMLFVFEKAELTNPDTPAGGQYLGEFKVTGVDATSVALSPAQRPGKRQLEQIAKSQPDWVMYEVMPSDRHSAFAGLDEAELSKLIPSLSRADYVKDENPADENTPAEFLSQVWVRNEEDKGQYDLTGTEPGEDKEGARFTPNASGTGQYDLLDGKYVDGKFVAGKFYERPLRDYAVAMRELHRELWEMDDSVQAISTQVEAMRQAVNGLSGEGGQVAAREKEIATLTEQLARVNKERDEIKKHSEAVASRVAELEQSISRMLAENKQLAEEWTASQLNAARGVNALSGTSAAAR